MNVLNWAGLVINGSVAFILPLVLCSYFYYRTSHHQEPNIHDVEMSHSRLPKHHDEEIEKEKQEQKEGEGNYLENNDNMEGSLPSFLRPYRWWIIHIIIFLFVTMIVTTITLDIVTGSGPH